LADQILALLRDPELCRRMRAANLEMVKQFEPVTVMREYLRHMETWIRR